MKLDKLITIEVNSEKLSGVFMVKEYRLSEFLKTLIKENSFVKVKIWH